MKRAADVEIARPTMPRGDPPLVAHVIFRLAVGGLENGLVNLINNMPPERYRHAVICLDDFTDFRRRIRRDDVQVMAMRKAPGWDLALYRRLWRLFRDLRPDIVHSRNLAALEAQLPAALAGVRARVHGEHGRDMSDLDGSNRKLQWLRRVHRPLVGHYITVSEDLRRYLLQRVGVAEARVTHICNGVDTMRFRPGGGVRAPLPCEGFADGECFVIGAVGRMQAVKDHLGLARAFAMLVRQTPDGMRRLRLVIVGDGPLRGQVQALLEQEGCASLAWLPGDRDDVPALMRGFDLFALSSLGEGISNTILEALASGLPVVATAVGGNPELVDDGVTGRLVPAADPVALAHAMAGYVADPALRLRHAQAARRVAEERFSLDAMVRQYMGVYDRVLAGMPARGRH